ncbi:putative Clr5 domain-containing protein [Seiridium unicorne]|uniref:Clr5 domain-containing protein n=1 Tax=Seiridium unicorne TaxID=138068 RepID=A0ABR2VGD3_9PEZI
MANSSVKPPPEGGSWATPHDWATHRATVTSLYEGQNMTLKKIMQIMENEHKFYATERMYKSRLKQWGLRKNYRYEEVNEIIRQQSTRVSAAKPGSSSVVVGSRVRRAEARRGRPSRRQLGPLVLATPKRSPRTAVATLQQLTPPSSGVSCRVAAPPGRGEISFLFPLSPPPDVRYPEECSFHISRYCAGAFEQGTWMLDSPEWLNSNRNVVDWFNRIALARGALAGGHTQQGFKLLQIAFNDYKDMIVAQDPRLLLYTSVALFLLVGYPEVVAMFLRYVSNLSRIIHGPYHPLHQIMATLDQMGLNMMQENARLIFDAQVSEFQRYLAPGNTFLQSITIFAIRNLAVAGLIDTDVAESKLRAVPREGDNGRISMALSQVLMMGGRYSEARRICEELLASGIDRTRTIAGGYDTLFLICRLEGKEEMIRDASNRRINFCTETFGPSSDWAVDACSDYEKYLRDIGDNEGADQVFNKFGVQMESLTEGVAELVIK